MMRNSEQDKGASTDLSLRAAGYKLMRTKALFDERVRIEGCHTNF